jgi:hypothetical protein
MPQRITSLAPRTRVGSRRNACWSASDAPDGAARRAAAVADVALIVLGGGIGANGDLLLAPIRALLAERCPYPPRVEVSSLGDAAVLTGALAIGLRAALDNVFVNRSRVPGRPVASANER